MGISPKSGAAVIRTVAALVPALALGACDAGREQELEQQLAAAEQEIQSLTRAKAAAEARAARAQANQAAPGFVEDDTFEFDPEGEPDPYDESFSEPQPMMPPQPPDDPGE